MKEKEKTNLVELKTIKIGRMNIVLEGLSPLIVHAWSEKSKREMLDKQMKKAKTAKEARDPEREYENCFYKTPEGNYGFPTTAFKQAAVSAAGRFSEGLKMTEMRGAFFIEGELVKIEGEPRMREDMVRIGMGSADLRYRPEFPHWKVSLIVSYNKDKVSPEQLVNIFNLAGFGVGVGEWRPERDGQFGRFQVVND